VIAQKVKLSDLFKIGSSKRVLKAQWQKSGVPFYRGREITKLSQNGFVDNDLFISEELYAEYAEKYGVPNVGDIVITAIGTIGNSYIVSEMDRFYFKDASVLWLKRISDVNSQYINLWLKSPLMRDQLDKGNGATVDTLTIKKLQGLTVDLPPIPEQKRIVALLDTVFADLEQTRAKTEQNLKNARELFDSYLQQVFSQKGDGWVDNKMGDVCLKIQDGAHHSPKKLYTEKGENQFLYITSKNIRNNYMDLSKIQYVDADFHETIYPRCTPEKGDVLLTKDGANTGNVTQNTLDEPFSLLSSVCLMKTDETKLNPAFLKYYLQSPMGFESMTGQMTGAAIKRIILRTIKASNIPTPPIADQKEIVLKFDKLLNQRTKLIEIYNNKLASLDELKKSILQKAFSGELTTTAK